MDSGDPAWALHLHDLPFNNYAITPRCHRVINYCSLITKLCSFRFYNLIPTNIPNSKHSIHDTTAWNNLVSLLTISLYFLPLHICLDVFQHVIYKISKPSLMSEKTIPRIQSAQGLCHISQSSIMCSSSHIIFVQRRVADFRIAQSESPCSAHMRNCLLPLTLKGKAGCGDTNPASQHWGGRDRWLSEAC